MSFTEKVDVLDLLIVTLREHEENIGQNTEELNILLKRYTDILEAHSRLLQALINQYQSINNDKNDRL